MYVCKYVLICTDIHVEPHTVATNLVETAGYHFSAKTDDFEGGRGVLGFFNF